MIEQPATFRFLVDGRVVRIHVETPEQVIDAEFDQRVLTAAFLAGSGAWRELKGRLRLSRPFRARQS